MQIRGTARRVRMSVMAIPPLLPKKRNENQFPKHVYNAGERNAYAEEQPKGGLKPVDIRSNVAVLVFEPAAHPDVTRRRHRWAHGLRGVLWDCLCGAVWSAQGSERVVRWSHDAPPLTLARRMRSTRAAWPMSTPTCAAGRAGTTHRRRRCAGVATAFRRCCKTYLI